MMKLSAETANFDLTLISSGITVTLRPLCGVLYQAARFAASNRASTMEWPEGLDRENEGHRLGVGLAVLAEEMARLAVVAWEGCEDDCTPDNAARLVQLYPLDGDQIRTAVTTRADPVAATESAVGNPSAPD